MALTPLGMAAAQGRVEAGAAVLAPLRSMHLVGHGDGPGIGMGQWGAFGYAVRYHFGYQRILAHFYGGTRTSTLDALGEPENPVLKVVILENLDLATNVGYDPVVTSASSFSVVGQAGQPGPPPARAPSTTLPPPTSTTTTLPAPSTVAPTTTTLPVATTVAPTTTLAASGLSTPPPGTLPPGTVSPGVTGPSGSSPSGPGSVPGTPAGTSPGPIEPTTTSVVGTSGSPATVPSTTSPVASPPTGARVSIPAGAAVDLHLEPNGTWSVFEAASCGGAAAAAGTGAQPVATGLVDPIVEPPSTSPSAPPSRLLTLCRHDNLDETLRGSIEAYDRQGYERTINLVRLESYLEGVVPAEVSASWGGDGAAAGAPQGRPFGFQALEAQAVASRSYALALAGSGGWAGYADICDTTLCQAYVGVNYEQPAANAAVRATRGQVQVGGPGAGQVVLTRYSASTGGWTAPSAFPAVPDLGDACVVAGEPLECNPVHTWAATLSGAVLDRAFRGLGRIVAVQVVRRDHRGSFGGRALTVAVDGTRRRRLLSAEAFAGALGLYSDWFAVAKVTRFPSRPAQGPPPTSTSPPPTSTSPPPTSTSPPPTSTSPPPVSVPAPPPGGTPPSTGSTSGGGAAPPTSSTSTSAGLAFPTPTTLPAGASS